MISVARFYDPDLQYGAGENKVLRKLNSHTTNDRRGTEIQDDGELDSISRDDEITIDENYNYRPQLILIRRYQYAPNETIVCPLR